MSAPSTSRLSAITVTSYRGEIWLLYLLVYLLLVFWHQKINNCSSQYKHRQIIPPQSTISHASSFHSILEIVKKTRRRNIYFSFKSRVSVCFGNDLT